MKSPGRPHPIPPGEGPEALGEVLEAAVQEGVDRPLGVRAGGGVSLASKEAGQDAQTFLLWQQSSVDIMYTMGYVFREGRG